MTNRSQEFLLNNLFERPKIYINLNKEIYARNKSKRLVEDQFYLYLRLK